MLFSTGIENRKKNNKNMLTMFDTREMNQQNYVFHFDSFLVKITSHS